MIARLCASRVAVRDRGRARRVRQDDAARAVGRGRSASVRVGRARRARRRRRRVPALHRGRDPPRRAAPARGVRRAVRPGRIRPGRCASRALGSALAALERPLVLVLDDLHAVANPSCLDVLAELVEYVPAGSQIAIASREEPALPLARWRAQGRLHEIGVADLRLDEQEAALLLAAAGVELDASELSELTERTEGWPAGLYLAALSMQAGAPSAAGAAGFTGDDRFVSEYFRLELLSRLPAAEARFLKHTSVLERMCGGLCDAVLETTRSAHDARDARARERLRGAARPARRVVSLPPPVRPAAAERARAERAGGGGRRSTAVRWPGASPTTCPRRRSSTGRPRARRTPSPAWSTRLALPLYYDGRMETVGGVARVVRRRRAGAVPGARRLRSLDPRADRAARRMPSGGSRSPTGRPRRSRSRMAAPRSSPGSPLCART